MWNKLPIKDKAKVMKLAVESGLTNLDKIKEAYNNHINKFEEGGNKEPSNWNRALYSTVNPVGDYPSSIWEAISLRKAVGKKLNSNNIDRMSYEVKDSVADAAWRKYNSLPYDEKFLLKGEEDPRGGYTETVRLPSSLEMEIPTDTTMLKNRIATNEAYIDKTGTKPKSVRLAIEADKQALEALRETYRTGEPKGINEWSHNTRSLGFTDNLDNVLSPLNILGNYNIRYDKDTNRMYYSDTYNFDAIDDWYTKIVGGLDKYLEGNPFRIRGYIDLPQK